jgi:Concanavalin A-like lectin/glucanases superfamily
MSGSGLAGVSAGNAAGTESLGGDTSGAGRAGAPPAEAGGTSSGTAPTAGSETGGTPSQGGEGGEALTGTAGVDTAAGASGEAGGPPALPDECPDDPDKRSPGTCGCGVPDVATATLADCGALVSKLVHRYDFEGTGTAVIDRVSRADGTARGATLSKLDGKGVVLLGGGTGGAFIDLPNGVLSVLTNASLESWVTWGGGSAWQRIFDIGDTTATSPENNPALGKSYLFATAQTSDGHVAAGFSTSGFEQQLLVEGVAPLAQSLSQIVVVADASADKVVLYVNGVKASESPWPQALSEVNDVNVWLGRSQFNGDPELSAVFHEFRVYKAALSEAEVAASFEGGPDPIFLAH